MAERRRRTGPRAALGRTRLRRVTHLRYIHGDPERVAVEAAEVALENFTLGRQEPWRVTAFAAAAGSVVRTLAAPGPFHRRIDAAKVPVLVIWGDADRLITRVAIDQVLERQPTWDLHVIPSVGHAPMLEAPDEFIAAVSDWLERHAAASTDEQRAA